MNDDDLNACAAIVEKGDPDRFLAAMAAPVSARAPLFALYAFNVEVARAPWVTGEAMIAEMRLQWWHDALGEIATAPHAARRHEVVTPLATLLTPDLATLLQDLIEARQWDIYFDAFSDAAAFEQYLNATSGHLMVAAASLLGQGDPAIARTVGQAAGLANWLRAVPALKSAGRAPLVDETEPALRALAEQGLAKLASARAQRAAIAPNAGPAFLTAWQAEPVLNQVVRDPSRVAAGTLGPSDFRRRAGLLWRGLSGRW